MLYPIVAGICFAGAALIGDLGRELGWSIERTMLAAFAWGIWCLGAYRILDGRWHPWE